jgi:hypothetical protein
MCQPLKNRCMAGTSVSLFLLVLFFIYYEVHGIAGIVEWPRTDRAGFGPLQGQRILFLSKMSKLAVGPTPPGGGGEAARE